MKRYMLLILLAFIGIPLAADAQFNPATGRQNITDLSQVQATGIGFWGAKSSGVKCDGSTDDTAAIGIAAGKAAAAGVGLLIPCKVRIASAAGSITVPVRFEGGGSLDLQTGGSMTLSGEVVSGLHQIFYLDGGVLTFGASVSAVYPEWWGAKADGTTDDTTAMTAAATAAAMIGTQGGRLVFSSGHTYRGHISITGSLNNSQGENGLHVYGYGAKLLGRSTDSSIIQVSGAVVGTDPPNWAQSTSYSPAGLVVLNPNNSNKYTLVTAGTSNSIGTGPSGTGTNISDGSCVWNYLGPYDYANGLVIEGLTLDMSAMTNASTTYGIAVQRAYNSQYRNIHVINEPNSGGGFYLGNNVYTSLVENLNCARAKVHGYNSSSNQDSTITFLSTVLSQLVADNTFALKFVHGAIQGSQRHVVLTNVTTALFQGNDLEGSSDFCYDFSGGGNGDITSIDNTAGGYVATTFATGVPVRSNLADRPPVGGGAIGTYAEVRGASLQTVTTTNPTKIYTFRDITPTSAAQCQFLVAGEDGFNGFADIVILAFQNARTVYSGDIYGSPPTRTYSYSSGNLQITLGSVAAGNLRVTAVENLGN